MVKFSIYLNGHVFVMAHSVELGSGGGGGGGGGGVTSYIWHSTDVRAE